MKIDLESGFKFGSFTYVGEKVSISPKSGKKFPFKCSCGRINKTKIINIANGQRKCSRCNNIQISRSNKFGNFTYIGDPIDISKNSHKKLQFKCSCGLVKNLEARRVLSGSQKTCGECTKIELLENSEYHGSVYVGSTIKIHPKSNKKLQFKCPCGKVTSKSLNSVTSGNSTNCGRCNVIKLITNQKHGEFVYTGPDMLVSTGSKEKLQFKCRCGTEKLIQLGSVTRGDSKTCGECFTVPSVWYERNKSDIRGIKCPASKSEFPNGGVEPVGTVKNTTDPFEAICPVCSSTYFPALHSIKRGLSLTCGCTNNKISKQNVEISEFISSLGKNSEFEFKLKNKSYDLAIQESKLLIEVHGLKWHAGKKSNRKDVEKFELAISEGYEILVVFEDEWIKKRTIIENIIKNKLFCSNPRSLRPSKCTIKKIEARDANKFYESYHYIGKCSSKYKYGVFFEEHLIACASFRKPGRQNCGSEFEISRMVIHPNFRIHGIWSKILKIFIKEVGPKSIVTYSDNRLFTGSVYPHMGFKFDGNIKSDYYWFKGHKRFHKSAMRKPKGCLQTEAELRTSQGYEKIWDYGKKRWVLKIK